MMMGLDLSALRLTKWHDYAIRFLLGGAITVVAGVIAKKCGAPVGGLFLAFPAIFPAAATLAQKHEIEKKRKHGLAGYQRGASQQLERNIGAKLLSEADARNLVERAVRVDLWFGYLGLRNRDTCQR